MIRRGIGVLFCVYCLTGSVVGQNFVNVAIGKTYNQSSTWNVQWPSSNAANNNTGGTFDANNCIHTKEGPNHWWEVDLGRTYPVHDITVWARTDFIGRLFPFNITVDNQPCVSMTSAPNLISRKKSVTCSSVMYGRVVRLTYKGSGPTLNLCEFQVFVCKDGFYGDGCSSNCEQNCEGGCHRTSGHCTNCTGGFWGSSFCRQNCPANCAGDTCQRNNGHCVSCQGNFVGDKCTACKQGFHGDDCSQACNTNCEGGCIKASGRCTNCTAGYWGSETCDNSCFAGCAGACDRVNGHCDDCKSGFWGTETCNKNCSAGCAGATCDRDNGHCDPCNDGFYGNDCSKGCDAKCQNGCSKDNGYCAACREGRYGPLCNETCSPGCVRCDQTSGNCTACASNSHLVFPGCTDCEDGYHRQNTTPCIQCQGTCYNNTPCNKTTGHCDKCPPGKEGGLCDRDEQKQEPPIMSAAVGATVGVIAVIVLVVAVIVVIVVRRRKRKHKSDAAKGEAAVIYSNLAATDKITESQATRTDDSSPSPSLNNAGNSDKPESDVKVETKPSVQVKADQLYENVNIVNLKPKIQSAKLSSDTNSASVVTSSQHNGVKKVNASSEKKGKPLVAVKPSKERAFNAGTVTPSDPLPDYEEEDFVVSDAIYANEELYANIKPTGIRVDKLQQTVVNKLRDGSLEEEFLRLIPKKDFALKNGERKENHYKNRFTSILPYDKNRVELEQVDGDDASDYVNASFVRGYKIEKAYIAAQGPRDNTVDDFWRMVWQEGVTDIVMLTNVKEGNKPKCYEYWPAQGDRLTTGHMEVTGVEEETRAHFVIRTFDLKQAEGSEKRRVKQYHYLSWMDHEVPATTPLVNFWRYVRSRAPRTAQAPPLVVHCSAGVGRTGTFIALDIIYDKAQQEAEVNIYNTVDRLRDDRCHLVQNKGQYAFLHEAVVEAYMSGDSRMQMSDMDIVLPQIVTHHTPHTRIDREFETLCKMRTTPTYTTAKMKENMAKNRNPDALPDDKHLAYITKHVKGRNQYINAVYMATFLQQRGSIMTQLPLQDTLVDFWRLVDGCDVNTIVSIGDVEGKKDMCRYWPKDATSTVHTGPYTIILRSMTRLGDSLCSYMLDMKTDDTSREVRVLHYAGWTGQVADNMADLIHLLTTLHTSHDDRGGKPVIVQCIDGASQSGVVCALWDVISRMTCDAELDVYMAVRQLHTVRPEALTSVEQYRYCYEVAQEFNKSNNIYANT